jgi:hypothetical protein
MVVSSFVAIAVFSLGGSILLLFGLMSLGTLLFWIVLGRFSPLVER